MQGLILFCSAACRTLNSSASICKTPSSLHTSVFSVLRATRQLLSEMHRPKQPKQLQCKLSLITTCMNGSAK